MKKLKLTNNDVKGLVHNILRQVTLDQFKPDYVLGITRGGLVPAVMISHYLGVPCHTLKVSLRDYGESESNLWMPEDAFGAVSPQEQDVLKCRWDINKRKNILIVDDIKDSGNTINYIVEDWEMSCFPDEEKAWSSVWNSTVKFAVLVNNTDSDVGTHVEIDYSGKVIDNAKQNTWIDFPWERWWEE